MIARAPGKLVLGGAYSVLYGAPAVVTAVNRYVTADSTRPASFRAPEVLAALEGRFAGREPPWYDASELRAGVGAGARKLGLGSSAAITVASLAALELDAWGHEPAGGPPTAVKSRLTDEQLAARVYAPARVAHRRAQGGGSGIDIAATCFGGTLLARQVGSASAEGELELTPLKLPAELLVSVYWSRRPASTPELVGRVRELERTEPARFARLMGAQQSAAEATASALLALDAREALRQLRAQAAALDALGRAASAPILTAEIKALAELSDPEREAWLPAGAGGGDVTLHFELTPSTAEAPSAIDGAGERLELRLGARGVHAEGA